MATSNLPVDYFDFFALARELRDQIYMEILVPGRDFDISKFGNLNAYATQSANLPFLLVSRQFSQEYYDKVAACQCLTVEDRLQEVEANEVRLSPPPAIMKFMRLHLNLYIASAEECSSNLQCRIPNEIDMHREWIQNLLSLLPCIRSFTMDIHCDSDTVGEECRDAATKHITKLTTMPHLRSIRVFPINFKDLDQQEWNYKTRGKRMLRWERGDDAFTQEKNIEE